MIVDASVLLAGLCDNLPDGRWAEGILAMDELSAPQSVLAETISGLRKLERLGIVTPNDAEAALVQLLRLRLELSPFAPFAGRVWSLRTNLSPYDAWYVAVAEASRAPLATLDRRLARAPGPTCEFLLPD